VLTKVNRLCAGLKYLWDAYSDAVIPAKRPHPNKRTPFTNTYPHLPRLRSEVCVPIPLCLPNRRGTRIPERRKPTIIRRFHNTQTAVQTAISTRNCIFRDLFCPAIIAPVDRLSKLKAHARWLLSGPGLCIPSLRHRLKGQGRGGSTTLRGRSKRNVSP
jgi:hypothetical protein